MAMDPLGADLDEHSPRPDPDAASDARPAWMGFLGGAIVLMLAILIAVGLWHFAGRGASPLTSADLIEAESMLNQLGFPPGPIDGAIDEQSRNAIRDFQVTAGLEVDGKPSIALLDELRAAKAELSGE
jgi:Putative peptidoglycan binding domain